MRNDRGFSIIELLIVVAVVGIVSAIAVPGLRLARHKAQSASAVQTMRMIVTAEHLYNIKHKEYTTLAGLNPEGTLDPSVSSGAKAGYSFSLTLSPDAKHFTCNATPQDFATTREHYFVDDTGVIRANTGAPADIDSEPLS